MIALLGFLAGPTLVALPASAATVASAGENLYRNGILSTGQPLIGERDGGIRVEGTAAACATCHRRSGLGMAEGQTVIPPITGKYLYRPLGTGAEDVDFRYIQKFSVKREAYTDATLMRAIREGIGRDGRQLNYLMPRFKLDDAAMASLLAYLKNLSSGEVPGVTPDTLHFATIITPDAEPKARQGMLDVLERFFADKNEFLRGGARTMQSSSGVHFRVTRRWQLHVWQLSGPAEDWEHQLHERLAAEPVFAVISGIGGRTWAPVHRFCEREAIPCLLPNVELPFSTERDFYSVYFSRGVLLEADLILRQRQQDIESAHGSGATGRIFQFYRLGDVGEAAAGIVRQATNRDGTATFDCVLKGNAPDTALVAGCKDVQAGDSLILWLRSGDLAMLPSKPPDGARVYVSGLMGGLENAPLPPAWRDVASMTYPFDLPESRRVRMNFPLGWFKVRNISVVAERVQTDTYLACGILAENLNDMLDLFVRDYLVERIEVMLSRKAVNGYYPRLSLAQGQRFASKGGYIVRFADPGGTRVVATNDWMVP
jgi:hypothetical protein